MPEGDTVHLVAARLDRALRGETLTRTDFRVPRHATADLSGRAVSAVVARGKHLLVRIDGGTTLHSHLGMEGSWHAYGAGERWRGRGHEVRVVLETDRHVAVGFRLPALDIVPTAEEGALVGHLGPDPLADDWDATDAARRIAAQADRAIADVLLDQTVIAGLGNVYKSELCFLLGVDPAAPVSGAGDPERVAILARATLWANRATGKQITTGDTRRGRLHWVYGRGGRRCRRCGTPIRRVGGGPGGERVTYWCPACQRS